MSIQMFEDRGFGVISCDSCPDEEEYEADTWAEFWARARAGGWRAHKKIGTWCHTCPVCVEEYKHSRDYGS